MSVFAYLLLHSFSTFWSRGEVEASERMQEWTPLLDNMNKRDRRSVSLRADGWIWLAFWPQPQTLEHLPEQNNLLLKPALQPERIHFRKPISLLVWMSERRLSTPHTLLWRWFWDGICLLVAGCRSNVSSWHVCPDWGGQVAGCVWGVAASSSVLTWG